MGEGNQDKIQNPVEGIKTRGETPWPGDAGPKDGLLAKAAGYVGKAKR